MTPEELGTAYAKSVDGCTPDRLARAIAYQVWLAAGKPSRTGPRHVAGPDPKKSKK